MEKCEKRLVVMWVTRVIQIRKTDKMFQGEGESQFIQAAGLAFDNHGNFLAICSKTSRISAFRADGSFMCDVSIGYLDNSE